MILSLYNKKELAENIDMQAKMKNISLLKKHVSNSFDESFLLSEEKISKAQYNFHKRKNLESYIYQDFQGFSKGKVHNIHLCIIGGDGGNRNRVRKPIPATFYECSLSFEIPLRERRQTGYLLRYPLVRDTLQG